MPPDPFSRRAFVTGLALSAVAPSLWAGDGAQPHQATGTRVGEVAGSTAVVWTRLTANPLRNATGQAFEGKDAKAEQPEKLKVDELHGACPGAAGRVRLRYGLREDLTGSTATDWTEVTEATDFIHQFRLAKLEPGKTYYYASETTGPGGKPIHAAFQGRFRTAPADDTPTDLTFCVMTCQGYKDRGHADGHPIYPAMAALDPAFAVLTGDLVYYDNDPPQAVNPRLARYHWERMFSLPRLREFTSRFGTYWLKDDHDTLANDTWPGKKVKALTFKEGQALFRQQAPFTDGPSYRTFRWGRDLQIWFSDGRDFRSPNSTPDGPDKTIWGAEQKKWFKQTVAASKARWKVLVSPTPLVGPDRKGKNDNHSNAGFKHEGDELRGWLKDNAPGLVVVCGDRHWQYHSVHPQTGLTEFSVGPASDEHAGGTPGEDREIHRFHRVKGGFLAVNVRPAGEKSAIRFELRDVKGKVVYSWDGA